MQSEILEHPCWLDAPELFKQIPEHFELYGAVLQSELCKHFCEPATPELLEQ